MKVIKLEELFERGSNTHVAEVRIPIPLEAFLGLVSENPSFYLRDIFQFFYDMVFFYVRSLQKRPKWKDFQIWNYDLNPLLAEGCDSPFFADSIFTERFLDLVSSFKKRRIQNFLILFEGPPGSGKSTFLNNLVQKIEVYGARPEGALFKTYWKIDIDAIRKAMGEEVAERVGDELGQEQKNASSNSKTRRSLNFSCPRQDHPIIQIPKDFRHDFLDKIIEDKAFKKKLFEEREYEWVFKEKPCNICQSLYNVLLERLTKHTEVLRMVYARRAVFRRLFGVGVSVFNPSDPIPSEPFTNEFIENNLRNLLRTDNIDFTYSDLSFTSNGVYALMDIKENNLERLFRLHGIISDGIHKVKLVEERIKSLFLGLVNPEDRESFENVKSFRDRIIYVKIPYVLDYKTEIEIYKDKFGEEIEKNFMPHILELFTKCIVASRIEKGGNAFKQWIPEPMKYEKLLDKNYRHLKIMVFAREIPNWLDETDTKKFDTDLMNLILKESESDGFRGISGRQSLQLFGDFLDNVKESDGLITLDKVINFFLDINLSEFKEVPQELLIILANAYDYEVTQEVKESMYHFNKEEIENQIANYLFAISFDVGEKVKSPYTNDELEITEEFFRTFEKAVLGENVSPFEMKKYRKENQHLYVNTTLAQEINVEGKDIRQTEQFINIYNRYIQNLKENALLPFVDNINFKSALLDYGSDAFEKYDEKICSKINHLITTLIEKFKYTPESAVKVVQYVFEQRLDKKY
ncbi:MAG: serine protein kinase PrkA [Ignavibacteria bacterium]|nr:serine protein kinase PrkA [Ignavibacteria bacterium]